MSALRLPFAGSGGAATPAGAQARRRRTVLAFLGSALMRRLLIVQLLLALVPLVVITYFALSGLHSARRAIDQQSRSTADAAAFQALQQRDLALAQNVASFLSERESNLRAMAALPRTAEAYTAFSAAMQAPITTVDPNGKTVTVNVPLFREVAFVDANGQEQVKAVDTCPDNRQNNSQDYRQEYPFDCSVSASTSLTNVSNPTNTLYKSETYFDDTMKLNAGQVYVGRQIGSYIPYSDAYAGAQKRDGQRFRGVIRFAMPVFDGGQKVGIVELALESIHLNELVAHAAPSSALPQAEIDPRQADFSYIADPDGWVIAHPRVYNIAGVDGNGKPVQPISAADQSDPNNLFRPADLAQMGFIDPALPDLVQANQAGKADDGITRVTQPASSPNRAIAVATIPYYTGQYNTPAGFGMVVMSTDSARFHAGSVLLTKQIDNHISEITTEAQEIGAVAACIALLLAVFFAFSIARPILRLTRVAHNIEQERWEEVDLEQLEQTSPRDELGRLTRVFASMARQVQERVTQLRKQVQQLQVVIDESKRKREVQEIVESDFFQGLSGRAQQLREQRQRRLAQDPQDSAGPSLPASPPSLGERSSSDG